MTTKVNPGLFARWAMSEGNMIICNVVKEVNFFLLQEQTRGNGMYWGVSPTLVEETSVLIKRFKEVDIGFRP
ncbi:hypothetical protein RRF57_011915 [Xylaria bambusicola]|uniref:Uncharacterized protein n=1 Tax=Xylaria bambusicola TaxID=326684 RepID=A0AAN7ZEG6_9PEZI